MMNQSIRNVAVIAHVDHGKTTLIDAMLKQTHIFRENQEEMKQERLMDSQDLEKERGITITAKNCAITYDETRINIIDTPGHADFSGEVERTLGMADGALLIVDAQEGPMPQTRFVLRKALSLNLKTIVVINKIDKPFARVGYVEEKIADLFLELAETDEHLDYQILYAIARDGKVFATLPGDFSQEATVRPLLDLILDYIPNAMGQTDKPFAMLVSSLDYDAHLGRIVIGKVHQGTIKPSQNVILVQKGPKSYSIGQVMINQGMSRTTVEEASAGEIVALTGIDSAQIGMTLASDLQTAALPSPDISEPTLHMKLGPNTSPFAGLEGTYTTSRQIANRLSKELEKNLSLRVEFETDGGFQISGKGELHLSVLLETMRREGYEMEVGKPEVIVKTIEGKPHEPVEEVSLVVPQDYVGIINQELGKRQANLIKMEPISDSDMEFIYHMPTRATIGLRSILITKTRGTSVLSSQVIGYELVGQSLPKLRSGVLIAGTTGKAAAYSLKTLKGRGTSFIIPGTQVYEGMIIGQNAKDEDIEINVCKEKNLTNHRSKSHQGITEFAPDVEMSLEESLDFIEPDELLEITPLSLRLRKKYLTDIDRRRHRRPGN